MKIIRQQILLTALIGIPAQATTFNAPLAETLSGPRTTLGRCTDDQVGSTAPARARIEWAYRCGHLDRNVWEFEFNHVWDRPSRAMVPTPAGHLRYPIFTTDTAPYTVWNVEAGTANLQSCAIPAGITFYDVCMSGCFEPSQEVLMADGYRPIGEVIEEQNYQTGIYTVKPGSTFERLDFQLSPIGYFIASDKETEETLIKLVTPEGSITVTKNHPLVNAEGMVSMASQFKVGSSLVLENGELSPIIEKLDVPYFGKVFNLAPVRTQAEDNIIVAQGFLNGSHRFQEGTLQDYYDIVVRREVPAYLY